MATVPAVYVTIEDRSFSLPSIAGGRSGLIVVIGDRGEHNRVVEVNSQQEFVNKFGKPDIGRNGHAHFLASKFLERSSRLFVIRPVILDSPLDEMNASIANQYIKYNDPTGSEQLILHDKFIFTNGADATTAYTDSFISKYVFTDKIGFDLIEINDYIYSEKDSVFNKRKVIAKKKHDNLDSLSFGSYYLELESNYDGISTVDLNNANALLVDPGAADPAILSNYVVDINNIFSTKVYEFYPGTKQATGTFEFELNSNIVIATDVASFNSINVEDWVYPVSSVQRYARQVVKKDISITNQYLIYLDMVYAGPSSTVAETVFKYVPFETISIQDLRDEQSVDTQDPDNLWYFYARGAGSYYNRLFVRAVRNITYEKMYLNSAGIPLYKYAFMDISVYQSNTDGTSTMLEGPWTISLMNRAGEQVIKDITTGKELYLTKVINERSKLIKCVESEFAANILEGADLDAEVKRLQVSSLFSAGTVTRLQTKGSEGFFLENGVDGGIFDAYGRIDLDKPEVQSIIARCYDGSFKSVDGSIESIVQSIYPWYLFDYVIAAGYNVDIQNAARQLVDARNDAVLLSDTGALYYNPESEIAIRKNSMDWNTWNAAIYTQYRKVFDKYSGKYIAMSPVFHAIDCHLKTDNEKWISDPVAGYVKGAIQDNIELAYKMDLIHLEDMLENEMNPTIVEPDGKYFLSQFTTYKPLSAMKRLHTVKFVQYIKKQIPGLLKDILQQKGNSYWTGVANTRVKGFMQPFIRKNSIYESISSFDVSTEFDEDRSELFVGLTIKPLRSIESIHVNIIVT